MFQRIEAPTAKTLRDGRCVTIRPLAEGDGPALLAFGRALPVDDWQYLEDDLQRPEIITRLVNAHRAENWRQLVAVAHGGEIVGYAAVRRLPGWSSHVGDIQLIVGGAWRRSGLGTALAEAIFGAAQELGVAKVIVEVLDRQVGGLAIFQRLGFHIEGAFTNHARDRYGNHHDLVILAYHIEER
ncbi:MAG TPA: GNAT family N-acetyltransferase [Roseiflexaceae bacterium]|nr:GNAT family N-acetyltransferase [Roseiflexaceae bacterium]